MFVNANCQTTLVIALDALLLYPLGRYEPSPPSTAELHGSTIVNFHASLVL